MVTPVVNVDVGGVVDGVMAGLDSLFTSDDERDANRLRIQQELQKPHMQQALITLQEAKHTNWFVAGWRPFIGWTAGSCLLYHWLLKDFIVIGIVTLASNPSEIIPLLPVINPGEITGLVLSLLGLGGLRTYERIQGKERN